MIERLRPVAGVLLLTVGALGVLIGGGAYGYAWYAEQAWARSDDAERLERQASAETPVWVDAENDEEATGQAVGVGQALPPAPTARPAPARATDPGEVTASRSRRRSARAPDGQGSARTLDGEGHDSAGLASESTGEAVADLGPDDTELTAAPDADPPAPRASAEEIELAEVEFRFLDPPEPGATARLAVTLNSRAELPSPPIAVSISSRWFEGFRVIGAIPTVTADRVRDGFRAFDFAGLGSGESITLELHLTATAEDVDAPEVRVDLLGGGTIAQLRPRTIAPRPRPGPVSALTIPRLGVRTGVVQTAWEPPPFVVGQLRDSAPVSQGNSVLIGHVGGLAGNVFAGLDQVRLGDEVVAVSRGLEYRFVISDTEIRPNDDSSPILGTPTARLTLMTCVGRWNPVTQDYSHRLWVVAEPPERADATIAANAERVAREAATREAAAREAAQEGAARDAATATAIALEATQAAIAVAGPAPTETPAEPEPTVLPTTPSGAVARRSEPAPTALPTAALAPVAAPTRPRPTQAPSPPTATALPPMAAASAPRRPAQAGLQIRAPASEARVPRRFVVQGVRTRPANPDAHIWLLVRADVVGSRWYAYPREIVAGPDGVWEAELDLDGPPDVRHELRVGVADPEAHAALAGHTTATPSEPLAALPEGFREEARVVVVRR